MFLLEDFNFTIKHTPRKEHALVDFLSCIMIGEPLEDVEEELLDANLFNIEGVVDWYDELLLFLESVTFMERWSRDYHKCLALCSQSFMVIARQL